LLISIAFRNSRLGIVAFATTLLPVVCGFGLWGLLNDSVGLSTTVIVAVCMGVVIDDAIHIIYRFVEGQQRLALDAREAAAYSIHRVGTSIVTSSFVLSFGFVVLSFSDFALNQMFGVCSALIVLSALLIDLLILPKMLIWAGSTKSSLAVSPFNE
jgi:predicted RND superfamily exporter protein